MKSILLIEDDSITRKLVAAALSSSYQVIIAEDGAEGLELAHQHIPDLIISDMSMPGLDGISLLRNLRADESTKTIPLLFLTGQDNYSTIRTAMSLGADDYLLKPFDLADLRAAIKATLLKQSQRKAKYENILRQLCHNISTSLPHELRTAVMVVQGYATILLEEKERLDPETFEMVNAIQRYSDRLFVLSEKMYWHSIAEITEAQPLDDLGQIESQGIIQNVAEQLAKKLGREADLNLCLQPANLTCPADFFERIVLEIIENAFKFSYPQDPVQVSSSIQGNNFILRVKDNGRGFHPQEIKQINAFMQFGRDKYEQQGTGLGLSIAKRLVQLLAGRLTVQSTPNLYTVVIVSLPLASE
jgi:two-component system sensor histidine kinase/response regulator